MADLSKAQWEIHAGDCLESLRAMSDNSVDSIVTDPPYGLSFMGKKWDYDVPSTEIWAECLRVLKPGGHLLAFAGTRTQHRMAVRIEDAGFEIRDMIAWIYGSGFPKSHNLRGEWEGWGTALKPALEPITVARKPLAKGHTIAANVLAHGTGAINVDGCRVAGSENTARQQGKDIKGGNWSGDGGRSELVTGGGTGRWPANLILDGSEEVVALFPQSAGQFADISHSVPSAKTSGIYGAMKRQGEPSRDSVNDGAVGFKMKPGARRLDKGSAARFFYCAKTSRKDRHEGLEDPGPQFKTGTTLRKVENIATTGNNHPTVKPTDLMAYLCRLVTPAGGIVLDPFMGSGSTGKAAILEGFSFIGCELSPEYIEIARARISCAAEIVGRSVELPAMRDLFAEVS